MAEEDALSGWIQEVYIENFLCCRQRSLKFCRRANFIQDNNPGRSVVLTAIEECLGEGRPDHRDLIRKEKGVYCFSARVRVTFVNSEGANGYRHKIYGDAITVERVISLSSRGDRRLLDCNINKHSRAEEEVDAMLTRFRIQLKHTPTMFGCAEIQNFMCGTSRDWYKFFFNLVRYAYKEEKSSLKLREIENLRRRTQKQRRRMYYLHLQEYTNIGFDQTLYNIGAAGELFCAHDKQELELRVRKACVLIWFFAH